MAFAPGCQRRTRRGSSGAGTVGKVCSGSTVIHGGVHVHLAGEVKPPVSVDPPAGWDELLELSDVVRSLLRAQVRAAQELPYRLPDARRPSLATVYVRQDLGAGPESSDSKQAWPTPIVGRAAQANGCRQAGPRVLARRSPRQPAPAGVRLDRSTAGTPGRRTCSVRRWTGWSVRTFQRDGAPRANHAWIALCRASRRRNGPPWRRNAHCDVRPGAPAANSIPIRKHPGLRISDSFGEIKTIVGKF